MEARSESWFPLGSASRLALATAVGVALLVVAWALLHVGFYDDYEIVDTPVYESYGEAMTAGEVPYRDFAVEYPPGALPVFLLPSLLGGDYANAFELVMLACAIAMVLCVAVALSALGASPARLFGGVAFAALAPLAVGTVLLTRFDLWPAALTAAGIAAYLHGRSRLASVALALAVAAKLYAIVLVPLALVYVARRRGRREAGVALAVLLGVVAAIVLPFVVVGRDGLVDALTRQGGRPLQVESLGASFLLAADRLGVYEATVASSHGSQNLAGSLPDALATGSLALQLVVILAVWIAFARRRSDGERLVAASAAAVVGFVAFGKVLSPQFVIWLHPLVPLVGGPAGITATGVFAVALVTTQLWFPFRYWDVVALEPVAWLVVVRDLLLVLLFVVLLAAVRRGRERARIA